MMTFEEANYTLCEAEKYRRDNPGDILPGELQYRRALAFRAFTDMKKKDCIRCAYQKICMMSIMKTVHNNCNFFEEKDEN